MDGFLLGTKSRPLRHLPHLETDDKLASLLLRGRKGNIA